MAVHRLTCQAHSYASTAIAHGFSKCDINKDALLDKSEFHSFIKMLSYYDMLYKQFLIMDASNDGAITYEEFEAFYLRLEPDVQLSKLHADFDAIDKSDDSEITAFELCFYLADAYARSKQSTLQSLKSMIGGLVRKKDKEAVVSTKTDVDMLVATKDELESVALANSSIPKTAEQTATSSSPAPQAKVEFRPEVAAAVVKKTGALTLNINLTAKDAHELFMLFDCGNQNGRYETKVENVSADENLMHVPFIQTQLGRGGQEYAYNVNMCFSFNYTHLPLSAIRDVWPDMYRHRRAFIRAFRAADKDQDGLIDESEFTALLRFLAYYDLLFQHFDKIDSDDDRRLTLNEFKQGHQLAGIKISDQQAEQLFMSIDKNNGGLVLFDEFCMFMATTYKPKELDAAYADIAAKNGTGAPKASMKMDRGATLKPQKKVAMAQQEQHVAPQTAPQAAPNVPPATLNPVKKPAALLSKKTTARVSTLTHKLTNEELKELFARFDVGNGNGFLSLAEIDKAVRDLWPEMYMHRPALMRAYKAADKTKDGFIIEDEFADMLRFLAYYDLMYQHFDGIDTDNDRRVSFAEFKKGHELAGIRIPEQQLHMAFCAIDLNAGGVVLFDEFCMYMAKTYRPTGMDQRLAAVAVANNATYEGAPAASQPQSHGRLTTQASPQMRRGQAPGGMGPMESGVKSMSIGRSDAGKASPFQQRFGAQLEEANTASGTKATGTGPAPRRAQQPQPTQHATSTSTTRAAPSSSQYAVSLASMHAVPSPSQQQKQSIFDGTIEGPTPARLSVAADEALRHEIRSLTHLVRFEQTEKHKLEATVMALKEHITRLGGNANDVQAAWPLSSFDTMTTLNAQLQEKLLQERQRYANLEHTLRLTKEKLLVKEDESMCLSVCVCCISCGCLCHRYE